ncbi:MAG TPA: dienelactone hydrolase family protein [Jatrophihabitans sp.]|nr:dienelactone hydrolase family protein [Jatrophihabitans sp.]
MTTVDLRAEAAVQGGSAGLTGYHVEPAGPGPWPGVIVLHEAFGLDEQVRRHAERIAAMGYLTLAPDLFSDGGARRCLAQALRSLASGQGRAYADIEAARQWLLAHPQCTGRIGVIGFCMGGGFALMTLASGFEVAAPNYGMLPKDIDAAVAGGCPVVASYGGRDRALKGAAARLDGALKRAGVPHDVREYPNAGHSFLNDAPNGPRLLRPLTRLGHVGPEPESAAQVWPRIEAFFARYLAPDARSDEPS